jgi:N-acylglucosamine-6-phosphate 2-epimerase
LTRAQFATAIRGRLIVSCQAPDGHPLRDTSIQVRLALAAVAGGAAAIRCGGVGGAADVTAIAATVPVPVIGLTKNGTDGVYITPTVTAAQTIARAGAHVVAVDGTARPRPDNKPLDCTVRAVHDDDALVMADVATFAEGISAATSGADAVATSLAGYTPDNPRCDGPDLALVTALRSALPDAILIAEGRIHTPQLATAALAAGADAVVVGTAITDPVWITAQFAAGAALGATDPPKEEPYR